MADTGTPTLDGVFATTSEPNCKGFRVKHVPPLLTEWNRRRRYREDLKRLLKVGPYMIADIGLTLKEALEESEKPFWRT